MDYIIKFSDPNNGQFTIKPYTTNGPLSPNVATPLDAHAISASTSIVLQGKGMYDYGESIAASTVHMLENFAAPTEPVYPIQGQLWYKNDTKELFIYDDGGFTTSFLINGRLVSSLDVNNQRIIKVAPPVSGTDAVNKNYVDNNFLSLTGGTLTGNLILSSATITGVPAPTAGTDVVNKTYVDDRITNLSTTANTLYVSKTGDTLTGNLVVSNNAHIFLPTPVGGFTVANDVVNKGYVDAQMSSSTAFVKIIGDTMTGPLEINSSGLYSGPTLTIVSSTPSPTNAIVVSGDVTSSINANTKFVAILNGSSGRQTVNFGGTVVGTDPTGLPTGGTAGFATITYTAIPAVTPTTVSGITPGNYDFDINVDGTGVVTHTILLNNTDTIFDIVGYINLVFTTNEVSTTAIANTIVFTSATLGTTSSVVITPTTGANPDVFGALDASLTATHTNVSTPGTSGSTSYTANINIDGTPHAISVIGANAQTFNTLITEINNDLGGSGAASISGGNILISSGTTGPTSTVAITDTDLFNSLTGYVSILTAIPGSTTFSSTFTALSSTYSAPNTTITTVENVPSNSTGVISSIPGLNVSNNTVAQFDGNVLILGGHIFDINNNIIHNVGTPTLNSQAANKGYVDTAITTAIGSISSGGQSLTSVTFNNNTLTFTSGSLAPIAVNNVASLDDTKLISKMIPHNISSSTSVNSVFRNLFNLPASTYPSATIEEMFNAIDKILYDLSTPNNRFLYTVPAVPTTTITLPFDFIVETNHLQVYKGGQKLYNSTRGESVITLPVGLLEDSPTNIPGGTPYSFDINVDAGGNQTVSITVTYANIPVTAVNTVNNSWTVASNPVNVFNQFAQIEVVGDTLLGGNVIYTIKKVVDNGTDTIIFVNETIGTATGDGNIRYPYTLAALLSDIQTELTTLYPNPNTPKIKLLEDKVYITSPSIGTGSSVVITDVSLFTLLVGSSIDNTATGTTYGFKELGQLYLPSNQILLSAMPTVGDLFEIINIR